MTDGNARLARDLVKAAMAFYRARPWEHYERDRGLALWLPKKRSPVFAVIMGHFGEPHGLSLWRGNDAAAQIHDQEVGLPPPERMETIDVLGFTVDPLERIPAGFREILDAAEFKGDRRNRAPFFFARQPGRQGRAPNLQEQHMLLLAIRAVLRTQRRGELRAVPANTSGYMLTLIIEGEPWDFEVRTDVRPYHAVRAVPKTSPVAVPDEGTKDSSGR